jgi:hypothetical protein
VSSITRTPKHVLTAASEGMKAGYRQFEAASSKSGLEPVQALWDEFAGLTAKPRFNLYCSMFGPSVDAIQASKPVTSSTFTRSSGRVKNASAAPIQEARKMTATQRIAELEAEIAALKTPAKAVVESEIVVKDPEAPVTYPQAMTLRFRMGLSKAKVAKLNKGKAARLITDFYATA